MTTRCGTAASVESATASSAAVTSASDGAAAITPRAHAPIACGDRAMPARSLRCAASAAENGYASGSRTTARSSVYALAYAWARASGNAVPKRCNGLGRGTVSTGTKLSSRSTVIAGRRLEPAPHPAPRPRVCRRARSPGPGSSRRCRARPPCRRRRSPRRCPPRLGDRRRRHGGRARHRRDDPGPGDLARRQTRGRGAGWGAGSSLRPAMTVERLDSFVPVETVPLPRPLHRFGTAFPLALAQAYASAYTDERAVVLDPLAYPFSAADAAQRSERAGIARSPQAIGAWARGVIAAAPSLAEVTAALEAVADSTLAAVPHRVVMRDLYSSHCATCRGPVVVEAFLWERDAPAPTKKAFRCAICAREGRALLIAPTSDEDEARARKVEGDGLAYWQFVERFGATEERRVLAQSIAALYTPRNLAALMATLRSIETALADGPAKAFLRLCLLEVVVSGSRSNAVAGHGAPLRIEKGRARRGQAAQSREVNVWLEFERTARELAAWLAANPQARSVATLKAPADLVLVQAPVEDPLGGWAYVASVLLAGEQGE